MRTSLRGIAAAGWLALAPAAAASPGGAPSRTAPAADISAPGEAGLDRTAPSAGVIYFNTSEGPALLKRASHDRPFWDLVPHLATELPGNCGPTTAVVILNALALQGVAAPPSTEWKPFATSYRYWDQQNLAGGSGGSCVRNATSPWRGSLEQVAAFFSCRGLSLDVTRWSASSAGDFRNALKEAFSHEPVRYVSVNFDRQGLHQEGGGHHSPIGAYDEGTDRVLVLDVARYKYPPWWAPLPELFQAMGDPKEPNPFDTPRGYLVVGGER